MLRTHYCYVSGNFLMTATVCIISVSSTGTHSDTVYPNGISCTLPAHLQEELVHTITGLESSKLIFPGTYVCTYIGYAYSGTFMFRTA